MKRIFVSDEQGEPINGLQVTISYPRKRAPYARFKVINLNRELDFSSLTGLQAKVLLALLWAPTELETKEIAALVGSTTNAACRALSSLTTRGLVVKVSHGRYYVKSDLAHFGKWNVRSIQHPQNRDGTE
jgi:hypothetical protein